MLDILYKDIGAKIKSWAKWIFIVEAVSAVIGGICLIFDYNFLTGALVLILGPCVAWVSSWLLYAFGELVEDVHAMRSKYYPQAEEKAKREAEERAQREMEEKAKREAEKQNPPDSILQKKASAWDHWNEEDSSVGQCELCGSNGQFLNFVQFEDSNGTHQKHLCYHCFAKRECRPVKDRKQP